MSEYEKAKTEYLRFDGLNANARSMYGKSVADKANILIRAADAEITRLQDLHLDRTKLTTQVIEERDRLKEELAECKEYLEIVQKWGDEV